MLQHVNTRSSITTYLKNQAAQRRHWRDTVVVILTNRDCTHVLFVCSARNGSWGPPKGGLEHRDQGCIKTGAKREVKEETGILSYQLSFIAYLGSANGEQDRQGVQLGKHFHCVHMVVRSGAKPEANLEENIARCRWVGSKGAFKKLKMKPKRRKIWLAAMRQAGVTWAQKRKK